MNLDLDLLRTFVAVADLNTFAAAAAAVCRTQSAVSQQMQRLEQLVGKELFARHGRNKLLTEHGIQLLGYARKILRFNDEACMSLMFSNLQGVLTLGASDESADTILPFLLNRISSVYPKLALDVSVKRNAFMVEMLNENKVDLVIGYEEGVDREALKKAGVQLYSPAAFCPNYSVKHATWDLIDTEVNNLASIFGVQDKAASVIEKRKTDVDALDAKGKAAGATGIALYITPGQSNFYAYGTSSMVQPIFEANGLKSSYEDNTTRVFDGSMEDILKRNPDWIVLLSLEATKEQTLEAFKSFNGADRLKAVANNQVVVLPFSLTDPPTTLSVKGATQLSQEIAGS